MAKTLMDILKVEYQRAITTIENNKELYKDFPEFQEEDNEMLGQVRRWIASENARLAKQNADIRKYIKKLRKDEELILNMIAIDKEMFPEDVSYDLERLEQTRQWIREEEARIA